jgi:glyoxylase I family protein
MKLEHVAYQVAEPQAMAQWYCEHLGMTIAHQVEDFCFFLVASDGEGMLEIYRNPAEPVPDWSARTAVEMHIAFWSDDVQADFDRLIAAGAAEILPPQQLNADVMHTMIRDPWGTALQLIHRTRKMY